MSGALCTGPGNPAPNPWTLVAACTLNESRNRLLRNALTGGTSREKPTTSVIIPGVMSRTPATKIIMAGVVLMVASISTALSGISVVQFWGALVCLGLGWNFMFIGGTTLLTECYTPEERAKTQAAHDFMLFSLVAVTAFASGFLHETLGWQAVNLIAAVPVSAAFLAAVWYGARQARKPVR